MGREYTCADYARIVRSSKRKLEQKDNPYIKENPRTFTIPPGFYNLSKKSKISYAETKLNHNISEFARC